MAPDYSNLDRLRNHHSNSPAKYHHSELGAHHNQGRLSGAISTTALNHNNNNIHNHNQEKIRSDGHTSGYQTHSSNFALSSPSNAGSNTGGLTMHRTPNVSAKDNNAYQTSQRSSNIRERNIGMSGLNYYPQGASDVAMAVMEQQKADQLQAYRRSMRNSNRSGVVSRNNNVSNDTTDLGAGEKNRRKTAKEIAQMYESLKVKYIERKKEWAVEKKDLRVFC